MVEKISIININKFKLLSSLFFAVSMFVLHHNAFCKKKYLFEDGKITFTNGNVIEGKVHLRKSYHTHEILYKKNEHSHHIRHINIELVKEIIIGNKKHTVSSITTENKYKTNAILEKLAGNKVVLYQAKLIDRKQLGKNNYVFVEKEVCLLAEGNHYVILEDSNFKSKLNKFWIDDQKYLDKISQYDIITKSELIEILKD